MSLTFDFIVIILTVVFIVSGYKKGFVRSILSFFSLVLVTVLASFLSFYGADLVYENFIKSSIINTTNNTINNAGLLTAAQKSQNLLESLPSFLVNIVDYKGTAEKDLEPFMEKDETNAGVAVANFFKDASVGFIRMILFFVLLAALLFLSRFLLRFISLSHVPVLGKVDSLLGATFGLLKCAIFVIIFLKVINFLGPAFNNDNLIFEDSVINNAVSSEYIKELNFKNLFQDNIYQKG
ncbi:MAG: hypothetical protein RUMPE_00448 [Eubacteriales bacterium SKADARSKE-1]|nr:hypothetical protein [Eubacteriales bacterium SKADARSKE-1]